MKYLLGLFIVMHALVITSFSQMDTTQFFPDSLVVHLPDSLVVHEWGTFTTLSTSSGVPLSGLYHDASRLPSFVYGLPFFNYDSIKGWPSPRDLNNVTVKMETPVLYFYSSSQRNIEVTVGFKGGTISQWFPMRADGERNPEGPFDMAKPYTGQIKWNIQVLDPRTSVRVSTSPALETPEWTAPRNTTSNLVRTQNGDVEKFLFYRGLGNIELPLKVRFLSDGRLSISNMGEVNISYVMIFETPPDTIADSLRLVTLDSQPSIWWEGALYAGQSIQVKRTIGNFSTAYHAIDHLQNAMVSAGLVLDESRALINTWSQSYFEKEKGLKVFWIVPRSITDQILPLQISPIPDKIERVIVGRTEILTPEFEDLLIRQNQLGKMDRYVSNKYYLPYLDLVQNKSLLRASVSVIQNKIFDKPKFHFDSKLGSTSRWRLDGRYFLPLPK